METDKGKLMGMLRLMHTIRVFEQTAQQLFTEGLARGDFQGALHSYEGEEAIAVGACSCLRKDDYVVSTHRGHGHCIAKGADVARMLAELQGRETGYSRGRGGSMHIFSPEDGLLGGNGIVGGGIPLALGAAFSCQYRETDAVCICFFGEGAASQGTLHESLNLAALWLLPVVYICENNLYAATTPICDAWPVRDLADRGRSYGIDAYSIDGNDVLLVHETVGQAVARARRGEGPTLIEAKTYRHKPHCMVIPESRDKTELASWAARDPITRFEEHLVGEGIADEGEIAQVRDEVTRESQAAAAVAREAPYPDPATVADGLWA